MLKLKMLSVEFITVAVEGNVILKIVKVLMYLKLGAMLSFYKVLKRILS